MTPKYFDIFGVHNSKFKHFIASLIFLPLAFSLLLPKRSSAKKAYNKEWDTNTKTTYEDIVKLIKPKLIPLCVWKWMVKTYEM